VGQDVVVEKMTQNHQFAILLSLAVGAGAVACTIFVHALAMVTTVNLFRYERRRGRAGAGALIDFSILALVIFFAFVAHLIEIALWAALLVLGGCTSDPVVAAAGTAGGDQRSAHVRCFGRNGLCCHTTVGSG
jgi:hypothetical protein